MSAAMIGQSVWMNLSAERSQCAGTAMFGFPLSGLRAFAGRTGRVLTHYDPAGLSVLVVHCITLWGDGFHCGPSICGHRGWRKSHLGGQQAAQGGLAHQCLHRPCPAQQWCAACRV